MARKTRKEKKEADKRRKQVIKQQMQAAAKKERTGKKSPSSKPEKKKSSKKAGKKKRKKVEYKETDYDKKLREFTLKDSVKTAVITILLFGVQVGIYVANQQGAFDGLFG